MKNITLDDYSLRLLLSPGSHHQHPPMIVIREIRERAILQGNQLEEWNLAYSSSTEDGEVPP